MASLELRNSMYRVVFMYGGRKRGYSLDTSDQKTAEAPLRRCRKDPHAA
jgi:hypothetical protein